MRLATILLSLAALTACAEENAPPTPETETEIEKTVLDAYPGPDEFDYRWPGHIAVNEEYAIRATFSESQPVCVSDSGTHIHGFRQWFDGDCVEQTRSSGRFISVWADYNSAFYNWDQAIASGCDEDSEPFDLGIVSTGEGQLVTCRQMYFDQPDVITVIYLAVRQEQALSGEEEAAPDGPDLIYTIRLGTTPEKEETDLVEFRAFLSRLSLAGRGFAPL